MAFVILILYFLFLNSLLCISIINRRGTRLIWIVSHVALLFLRSFLQIWFFVDIQKTSTVILKIFVTVNVLAPRRAHFILARGMYVVSTGAGMTAEPRIKISTTIYTSLKEGNIKFFLSWVYLTTTFPPPLSFIPPPAWYFFSPIAKQKLKKKRRRRPSSFSRTPPILMRGLFFYSFSEEGGYMIIRFRRAVFNPPMISSFSKT